MKRLIAAGVVSQELLATADHEAEILAHPYIGVEHLELGRPTLQGRYVERDELRQAVSGGVERRWWRPRGRRSALRPRGLRETTERQTAAKRADQE